MNKAVDSGRGVSAGMHIVMVASENGALPGGKVGGIGDVIRDLPGELAARGISAAVIDLPWLNRIDDRWVREALAGFKHVFTLDNHYLEFGQGVMVAAALARAGVRAEVTPIGLKEIPACGSNADVLAYHGLDGASIARTVMTSRKVADVPGIR